MIEKYKTSWYEDPEGKKVFFHDKDFILNWKKIEPSSPCRPIKRSSHSMNLFQNRFLVLIGGETPIEQNCLKTSDKKKLESASQSKMSN